MRPDGSFRLTTLATRASALLVVVAVLAGCGSAKAPSPKATSRPVGIPRLDFAYATSAPLRFVDRGRVARPGPIAVHDIAYSSSGKRIGGYLLLPPGRERRPAVVVVHGSGGDRGELLEEAAWLAARNVVALTITEPSTSSPPVPTAIGPAAFLTAVRDAQVHDVVAIRRAVDLLRTLPQVDPDRLGYLGWSAGAKTGTFLAASEPRLKALVLLSAGADPLAAFVAHAPPSLRAAVRQILGSVDPIRYIARARPGSVLLEDGTKDEIVPHQALLNIIRAAPSGTRVRWFDARHALNRAAYHEAFNWLARKLPIGGPRVAGAATE